MWSTSPLSLNLFSAVPRKAGTSGCLPPLIRFQIESRTCSGAILRGAHGKNTVLRRWMGIRRLSGCSGIGLKPYNARASKAACLSRALCSSRA
ncbi:hypothetical protein E5E91_11000 [Deinococcus radiodurans R1 = ATCC 13939 = DSM 20539]|uniref:Uncharacterized protein n=1 Tax=Deinococcus radiodurans (strain ATCC 13939 / DSM 20539 / JCM 16871 / CCUG 27074 / LMG 4051 / NBRC 15346 / NCIMB 9279 / VKM B-1422 / R1) TaxID=243230 RepID=Q9RSJ3_DEIRA|nr:hypothetical protein DR_2131 [Deinococcus radiodurans R1 = ATCC 13939 = DSM 20539]QEM71518.1 hypothetical protein DXG80_06915 [Deinococcus radiodurans]UDL01164.1 hypothetical protein E5E91_11000 [Deinococcus radiodurans R1 = ATCC 13939 = DSM 20539]